MANIKWKCNDCEPNHYFEGDKFTSVCPICKSENIEQLQEDRFGFWLKYVQDNWKIVLPIALGIFLLLLWLNKVPINEGGNPVFFKLSIEEQKPGTNYLVIKMEKWDSIDGHWVMIKENLSENAQIDRISNFINFLSLENKQIKPIGNKIYLCDKDTTDRIIGGQISVEYKGLIPTPQRFKKPIPFEFHLNGIQPDSKANCDEVCNLESKNIRLSTSNCILKIKVKNATPIRTLLVSVNGINGDYKKQLEWSSKEIKKYDVWVKYENSTCNAVSSIDNGTPLPINSCKECRTIELSNEFSRLLNNLGKDPNNRNTQKPCSEFYKSFIGGNNRFIINNKVRYDWSEMMEILTNESADYNKTFKLKYPVTISNNCSDVTIEFIYD